MELLTEEGFTKYREYVSELNQVTQNFFNRDYMPKKGDQYLTTREEVRRRMQQLLSNEIFRAMFCQPDLSIDFGQQMQAGRMILIDTNVGALFETNSRTMGALFIGMIYRAVMSRDPDANNTPCFIYIDECWEYFAHTGEMLTTLLAQARKRNVGLILAHQNLEQLQRAPGLYSGITGTSIKMAGGTIDEDSKRLASMFSTTAEQLKDPGGKGRFLTQVANLTRQPALFQSVENRIEKMHAVENADWHRMRMRMRKKYGVIPGRTPPPQKRETADPLPRESAER